MSEQWGHRLRPLAGDERPPCDQAGCDRPGGGEMRIEHDPHRPVCLCWDCCARRGRALAAWYADLGDPEQARRWRRQAERQEREAQREREGRR
ncbi:MAG TPA: hypothetical protein VFD01_09895 [Candidatus Dormibacteraeota bacterium]|jgi:hypothetical protein|nr:hypothetical protein [Candidatus Dormibacteraeota bacterium]